jgi:UDP-N-acetylmuramate dehydrogenase
MVSNEENLLSQLRARCKRVEEHLSLADLTTYKVGGSADLAAFPQNAEELAGVKRLLLEQDVPHAILGGGSNVLISDRGIRGAVVVTSALDRLEVNGTQLAVGAGVGSHAVAAFAHDHALQDAAFLAWLPGSIGGACYMNAKAYGGEISEILIGATVVDRDGKVQSYQLGPADFSYKTSPFQGREDWLAELTFQLQPGMCDVIQAEMDRIEASRRGKNEMSYPSCGCVFKNDYDIGRSSGKIIDECGLQGFRIGDAQVSPHHANFVINLGHAKAADIAAVVSHIHREVKAKTGFSLELEVQLLGEWQEGLKPPVP